MGARKGRGRKGKGTRRTRRKGKGTRRTGKRRGKGMRKGGGGGNGGEGEEAVEERVGTGNRLRLRRRRNAALCGAAVASEGAPEHWHARGSDSATHARGLGEA